MCEKILRFYYFNTAFTSTSNLQPTDKIDVIEEMTPQRYMNKMKRPQNQIRITIIDFLGLLPKDWNYHQN